MKNKGIKLNGGITLIALVITIIVLLILAGVAISMLSGENGILKKATEAKTKTEESSLIEQIKIVAMEAMTNAEGKIKEDVLKSGLTKIGIKEDEITKDSAGGYVIQKDSKVISISKSGKVEELTSMSETDKELASIFKKANSNYKCLNGYITGIDFDFDSLEVKNVVKDLEDLIKPYGYKVTKKYNAPEGKDEEIKEEEKESTKLATGIAIEKDNNIVARTVVFGDVTCDATMENGGLDDAMGIGYYYNYIYSAIKTDFQKVAANIYDDKEINGLDELILLDYVSYGDSVVSQNKVSSISGKDIKRLYKPLQQYIAKLDKTTGYSFEYNEEQDTYKLKGVKTGTKAQDLINALPESSKISIRDTSRKEISGDSEVLDGYYIRYKINTKYEDMPSGANNQEEPFFASIEVTE